MRKLKLFLLISALCLVSATRVSAHDFEVDGIYYNIISSTDCTVAVTFKGDYYYTWTTEYNETVTIPESVTYNNMVYRVTEIENKAFYGCNTLTSLNIPEGVTSIGECAFYKCSSLASINIPKSVTKIGYEAFYGCSSIEYVTLNCPNIKTWFSGFISIKEIVLGEGVTSIEYGAFSGSGLESITIPDSVTSIGDKAFYGCSNLMEVTFKSVTPPTFGKDVFIGINAKAIVNYPEGSDYSALKRYFSNLGAEVINGVSWIVEDDGTAYAYPCGSDGLSGYSGEKTIKKVYAYDFRTVGGFEGSSIEEFYALFTERPTLEVVDGFQNCMNLKVVCLQSTVTGIGDRAFWGCKSLKYIHLPEGLTNIGECAFDESGIEFLIIPESVMYIGDIYEYPETQPLWIFKNPYGLTVMEKIGGINGPAKICIPVGAVGYEYVNENDKQYYSPYGSSFIVSDDKITVFGDVFESYIKNFNNIEITPDAGYPTWVRQLPATVTIDVLKGVTDDYNLLYTIEGSNAIFSGDNNLLIGYVNSVIPNGTKSISAYAFSGCKGLTSIKIPNSVTSIHPTAFSGCYGLDTIIVDEANPVYDSRGNCNAIIETQTNKLIIASGATTIPLDVTSIGEYAFSPCENMDVAVPSHVTSFGNYAFNNTKSLYFESITPPTIDGDIFGWGAIFVPSDAYDAYCNADVWSQYKDRIVTKEMAEKEVEAWSTEGMSGILNAVGLNEADKVVKLKVKGEINSYDMIVIRDKMPLLNELDLSEAVVVASSKPFYQTYCTGKNSLGGYAFYDLDKLVSVKLPKDLTTLGDYAFYACANLTSVDASATEALDMGIGTFLFCDNLREFIAPPVISNIASSAFGDCTSLKELNIQRIIGSIESGAFSSCGIRRLDIDSIGGNISSNAFGGCSSLQEVKIGTLVGDLGGRAFYGCSSLRSVEFVKGPQKIESNVFLLADNLETFVAGEGTKEILGKAFLAANQDYYIDIFGEVHEQLIDKDRLALKRVVLPESLQKIGEKAFYRCTSLCDFSIPQSVTSIDKEAFYDCRSIESVVIPNGVKSVANRAFMGCNSLRNITFPDELSSIGVNAFYGCGIETLKLPPMLRTIDERAFGGCSSLKELHIPSSMEGIGSDAFSGCDNLNAVYTYTIEPTEITETTFSTFASASLYVPATSFWNYYWDIGWSRFNHKNFKDFNEKYDYFYLNNDYYLNGSTGYIEGTPDADLRPGSGLVVEADKDNADGKQSLGDVSVGTDVNGNSASIIGDENLSIENLNVKINVKGGRWYFFAFPWDVSLDKVSMQSGSDYVFRYYDGEERAKNGQGGWKDVSESHLKAANGYIFQCSADDVLLISIEDVKFDRMDKFCELVTHSSHNLNDASWNLMGNPYLSYYDMAAMDYSAPVTVWDGEKYVAIRPGDDDYQFAPYEAFFVQKPEGEESVGFSGDAQMTKTESTTLAAQQAKARRTRSIDPQRQLINLVLSHEETSDRTRVVFNNRQSHNYEVACDAAKFQSEGVAQIYTLDGEGVRYAINERPVGNGVVQIGYTAVENGYYTIEAVRMDTEVYLYDAETKIMHSLDEGSYTFFSGKGTFEKRFTLGKQDGETTSVENIDIDAAVEVVEGGILLNTNATATVYNAAGMVVAIQQGAGFVQLPAGTYVVCIGEKQSKVVVK